MNLSPEQEQDLLSRYAALLMSVASKFYFRYNGKSKIDLDDCLQECRIVFLAHIRRVESEDQILPLPYRDFMHAMCVQVLGFLPTSVPRRTTGFRHTIENANDAGSVDAMMEEGFDVSAGLATGYAEVDESVSFGQFFSELTPYDQRILLSMLSNGRMADVAADLGVDKSTVSRHLAHLKRKYLADCKTMGGMHV